MQDRIGIGAGAQKLQLLVDRVGGAEQRAKFVGSRIKILQLAQLRAKVVRILRIPQQVLLQLLRCQRARQIIARLLAKPRQLDRVGLLAGQILGFDVALHPLLRPRADVLDGLLGFRRQHS